MYVIGVGAGKVGWNLARELIDKGNELTVIENDRSRFGTVEEELEHAAQYGDGSELWVLERAGIERADLVIAVTGDDEDNILICQVAREKYGVDRVIARCNNPRNLQHFELLGVKPAVSATDLILRDGTGFVPLADSVVEAGDEVLLVLDTGLEDKITERFAPRGEPSRAA